MVGGFVPNDFGTKDNASYTGSLIIFFELFSIQ